MQDDETKRKAAERSMRYAKKRLKRVPLDVRKEEYEEIASAAEAAGESVRAYILGAVRVRMAQDGAGS